MKTKRLLLLLTLTLPLIGLAQPCTNLCYITCSGTNTTGCTSSASYVLPVNTSPVVSIIPTSDGWCANDPNGNATFNIYPSIGPGYSIILSSLITEMFDRFNFLLFMILLFLNVKIIL